MVVEVVVDVEVVAGVVAGTAVDVVVEVVDDAVTADHCAHKATSFGGIVNVDAIA